MLTLTLTLTLALAPAQTLSPTPTLMQAILQELMSGKKNLLTRHGVVSGVEVARALGAFISAQRPSEVSPKP